MPRSYVINEREHPPSVRAGFTLIELVVVVLILGILAGVAAPRYFGMGALADLAAEKQIVRRVNDGIELYYLQKLSEGNPGFPSELDSAASGDTCTPATPCFDEVLKRGIRDGRWQKTAEDAYQSPMGLEYTYDPATGAFSL